MKRSVLFFAFINFSVIDSSVLAPKNGGSFATELNKTRIDNENSSHSVLTKTFLFNGSYVYLEDVLYVLKNQNWTQEEQPCLEKTLTLLRSLQNFTLWAVWDWDSIPAEPEGLLYGSRFQLGNYDQCMDAPWYEEHEELRAQYCLADIHLERTDQSSRKQVSDPYDPYQSAFNLIEHKTSYRRPLNELLWGVCVPAECPKESVTRLMGILLAHSHLGTAGLRANVSVISCEKKNEQPEYDLPFYSFVAMVVLLTSVAILCTILNRKGSKYRNSITRAFDMNENARNLLTMNKEGTEVLYGIRFLTICVIVVCHQFGLSNAGPVSNGYRVDKDVLSVMGMFILHNDVSVDTFFWLSGFLTATLLSKSKRSPNLPIAFLKRYIRLMVAYGIAVFYMAAVLTYTGNGPVWKAITDVEANACRKNWWLNLLMVNNYIDTENMCIVIAWYIPCDFHFYVVTLTMYWIYTKCKTVGKIGLISLLIGSIVTPGIINYIHNLPPVQLFTYEFYSDPRRHEQFHLTYIKSHTRYAAYLVGVFTGFLFVRLNAVRGRKISQKWAVLGAGASILIMGSILFSGPPFLWRGYNMVESVLYAALNRPIWCCSISVFVLSCSFGHVPVLKGFLSWKPFVPLSRLTYGLYLIHPAIIMRNVSITRNLQHHDNFYQLIASFGAIFVGLLGSFFLWLLAEGPFNNLARLMFMSRMKLEEKRQDENKPDGNTGHLQDNLPPTVHVIDSSKI